MNYPRSTGLVYEKANLVRALIHFGLKKSMENALTRAYFCKKIISEPQSQRCMRQREKGPEERARGSVRSVERRRFCPSPDWEARPSPSRRAWSRRGRSRCRRRWWGCPEWEAACFPWGGRRTPATFRWRRRGGNGDGSEFPRGRWGLAETCLLGRRGRPAREEKKRHCFCTQKLGGRRGRE